MTVKNSRVQPFNGASALNEHSLQGDLGSNIRVMAPGDVAAVVEVHLSAFEGFFLSFLGPRFLHELYSAIVADPSGIAYVYVEDDAVRGFVAGTAQPSGFYRSILRRHLFRFAWASMGPFLRQPTILPRLLRALRMPSDTAKGIGEGTLMSIAVDPSMQGRGAGKVLVHAFILDAEQRGLRRIDLTTDAVDNDAANGFYKDLGFELQRTYSTPEGRAMNAYVLELAG